MNKTSLIIDTDPGIDDAVALVTALFSPNVDIKLLTSTAGNLGIDVTTKNLLHILELYNSNIPVAKGAISPLSRPLSDAAYAHGKSGLGGYLFDDVSSAPIDIPAFEAMHRVLSVYNNTTILVLGPLTNVALLLKNYPDDAKFIESIVFMGGTKDNVLLEKEPYYEFNIARDPEAAEIVLQSPCKKVMIPMDFGHYAFLTLEEIRHSKAFNATGHFFAKMFEKYDDYHVKDGAATHDSCAVAYVIEPSIFKIEKANAYIKYYGDKGVLISDINSKTTNVDLAVNINIDAFKNLYFGLLSVAKMKDE